MAKSAVMAAMMTAAVWCSPMSVSATPLGCAANLNGDGTIGSDDLALMLGDWGQCEPEAECPCDLTGDGMVASGDLALLLGMWGEDLCSGCGETKITAFYECFDLDSGDPIDSPIPGSCDSSEAEFHFAYNGDYAANGDNPTRLFNVYPALIAFLQLDFDDVTCTDVPDPSEFSAGVIDEPLELDDTVIILTVDGGYYKVGNAVPEFEGDEYTVAFDYAPLFPPNGASE